MQEEFDRLTELLDKTQHKYSIRYMRRTSLGDVWSCHFKPMSSIWDGSASRTIYSRDLSGIYSQAYDIIHDKEVVKEMSLKDELAA